MGQSASAQYLFDRTMDDIDFERYSGVWYEAAKLPMYWEKDCAHSVAKYRWNHKTNILQVENSCVKYDGSRVTRNADAWVNDPEYPGVLTIEFNDGLPSWGKGYYLLHYTDYDNVAVVGSINRNHLWILSRSKRLDKQTFKDAFNLGISLGYDMHNLMVM